MATTDFQVSFWGVRGSLPVPGPATVKFGGNTSCVQVQVGERLIILDAGTGIYKLGQHLIGQSLAINGEIFITHTHWDHIQGFPFFAPAFIRGNHFILYGPGKVTLTFADLMKGQMMYDHFPVTLDQMGADIEFRELQTGMVLDLGDGIAVSTVQNNHPGGSLSYRFDYGGRSCCYLTDHEHYPEPDPGLIKFASGADLVIYDSNFTAQEYIGTDKLPSRAGWGHSTWEEGIKLVKSAQARKLILFHHANYRSDDDMERIEQEARKHYPNVLAAREGMVICL